MNLAYIKQIKSIKSGVIFRSLIMKLTWATVVTLAITFPNMGEAPTLPLKTCGHSSKHAFFEFNI